MANTQHIYVMTGQHRIPAKIIENAGLAKVKKDADGDWQVDSVEFYDKKNEIEQS